jgi:hydroxylaminobenzene mutase
VHTLSAFSGVLMLALGLVWPRLNLGATTSRIAFWFLMYSDFATVAGFLMAGVWGAGNSIIPLAAGAAHGFKRLLSASWRIRLRRRASYRLRLFSGAFA